jgi:hypothetical protein
MVSPKPIFPFGPGLCVPGSRGGGQKNRIDFSQNTPIVRGMSIIVGRAAAERAYYARFPEARRRKNATNKAARLRNRERWQASQRRYRNTNFKYRFSRAVQCLAQAWVNAARLQQRSEISPPFLGCSLGEFRIWFEGMFTPEMTWDNYGVLWEVDHILPCASFDLATMEGMAACGHFSNLRPLLKAYHPRGKSREILK